MSGIGKEGESYEVGLELEVGDMREEVEEKVAEEQIANWKGVFLIFRSVVGIGVLTMPHTVQHFGVYGSMIFFPIFVFCMLYVLDCMLHMAQDLGFNGSNVDDLIVKSGNKKWLKPFSIVNNLMMIAAGIVNCIFAVMFLSWATCSFGWSICGNKWLTHGLAISISLPFAMLTKMNFYVGTSLIATVVICVTVNVILGYQINTLFVSGVSNSVTWLNLWHLGEFFGVACFSVEGIGLIFPIRSSMRDYLSFRMIFHVTCGFIVFWYFLLGSTGAMVDLSSSSRL